jgi:hypothetical protein
MRINLKNLAKDIAAEEGLKEQVSIAQITEIIGILGRRWRGMPTDTTLAEVSAIIERAGMQSAAMRRWL